MKNKFGLFALLAMSSTALAYEVVPGEFIVRKTPDAAKKSRALGLITPLAFTEQLPDGSGLVKGQSVKKLEDLKAKGIVEDYEPNYVYKIDFGRRKPSPPTPPTPPTDPWPEPVDPLPPLPPPVKPPPLPVKPPGAPFTQPSDPMLGNLWGFQKVKAREAWTLANGGGARDVVTVVIDTGIDGVHPDLKSQIAAPGYNAITGIMETKDTHGHGTHCAGTIAAASNSVGVTGVAWGTRILSAKFLAESGTTADAIKALEWAIDQPGVKVLSNSWGGGGPSRALFATISRACKKDILFVVAAGNDNSDNDSVASYPANYKLPCLIAVAATDPQDKFATFSNWGAKGVQVAAPGVNILSTYPGNRYASLSGTSMATPHVSGIAALMFSVNSKLTAVQAKAILEKSAEPLPMSFTRLIKSLAGESKSVVFGRVNAQKAIELAVVDGALTAKSKPLKEVNKK